MNMFNNALLKEYRKNKGLTQYDASKKIGVARTTYADYENGKIQPPIEKIRKISDWLDLPLEKLMNLQYEDYAELIGYEFAKLLGMNCAQYDLAIFNDNLGVITKSIVNEDRETMVSGSEIISTVYTDYILILFL